MRENDETDNSGTTAQFRAFVSQPGAPEAAQPWTMRASGNRVAMLTGIVIAVAVVLVLVALLVIH